MVITPDALTQPYWDACRRRELRLQRCRDCLTFVHFPGILCSQCGGARLDWERVSGKGRIHTFVVVHHATIPDFKMRVPYAVAWIELDESPSARVLSDLVDCDASRVQIDQRVELVFDDRSVSGFVVPRFRPLLAD
jgi:uncharacterized protein